MESVLSHVGAVCSHGMMTPLKGLGEKKKGILGTHFNPCSSFGGVGDGRRLRRVVVVKAEGVSSINPDIRKNEEKVVDSVVVTELSKPLTPYCR